MEISDDQIGKRAMAWAKSECDPEQLAQGDAYTKGYEAGFGNALAPALKIERESLRRFLQHHDDNCPAGVMVIAGDTITTEGECNCGYIAHIALLKQRLGVQKKSTNKENLSTDLNS